jgi:glyoxylase-like metal-dependent hydrolase (beta-lactamase superfamily II)/rhodanese-related sulfurtransferase
MILEQYYLGCLSQASYLIGDEGTGAAAIVDPRRDVDLYIDEAQKRGLALRHVILTHFHADFVAGHLELRERTGATIHLGAHARASYPFEPLAEGDEVVLGRVRLRALETPGHTPEGISLLVFDGQGPAPKAVLTGDTLFIGDVGRPDLMASAGMQAGDLAGMLYDSTREKLMTLPDDTLVYPGHGAGSACGKNISKDTVSTIGAQKRLNAALQPMSRDEFIALVTAELPAAPSYFAFDAGLNREERPRLEQMLAGLRALSFAEVERALAGGALALDVRDPELFAAGHLAGALSIGLDGRFASWAGTVIAPGTELVLIAPAGREREAALRLGRIGYDRVAGYLAGGLEAVPAGRRASVARVDAPALSSALSRKGAPRVLDVRERGERAAQSIEGSLFIPLGELAGRASEVPAGALVVHCAGGYRSMIAASLLARAGREDLADLRGGMGAWNAAGLPTVAAAGASCS